MYASCNSSKVSFAGTAADGDVTPAGGVATAVSDDSGAGDAVQPERAASEIAAAAKAVEVRMVTPEWLRAKERPKR